MLDAKQSNMALKDVKTLLDKDRLAIQGAKSRKVCIESLDNKSNKKLFDSIGDCVTYLNNKAPSNKTTLHRRIDSGIPYHGFICKWESKAFEPLTNKSVRVKITHVPTGITKTYSSFRKAALSFSPKYVTNASTVKIYSENGKLFKGEYKISVSTMN